MENEENGNGVKPLLFPFLIGGVIEAGGAFDLPQVWARNKGNDQR
jgi:hypothetical protein